MKDHRTQELLEKIVADGDHFPEHPNRRGFVLAQLALGRTVDTADFSYMLDRIYYRQDCTDFDMNVLLRIMYLYGESSLLDSALKERIKDAFYDYDYWIHRNNKYPGKQIFWTENHVMQYVTAEYLITQLYPEEAFRMRGGKKGWEIAPLIREKVLDWIMTRAKTGFCEWNSNVYADENFHALLNLYDFSRDPTVQSQAKKLLDVMLFELAVNLHRGAYCCSHGRVYDRHVTNVTHDATSALTYQLWGLPDAFDHIEAFSGLAIATSTYRVPEEITRIAVDRDLIVETKAQHSFDVEDGPRLNHGYESEDDLTFYWQNMAYTHRSILPQMVELEKRYNINVNEWPYREYEHYLDCSQRGVAPPVCRCTNYLSRANIYTYKTPEYLMSCAQDFRKGERGYQQHIWQATLGDPMNVERSIASPGAIIFTTHPGQFNRPSYWAGNDLMPRAVQYRGTVICLYDLDARKPGEERLRRDVSHPGSYYEYTHAFFPKAEFDHVSEDGAWVFARRGDAYAALFSQHPARWRTEGEYADRELICHSRRNIWICHLGSAREDGSFERFIDTIRADRVLCDGLRVRLRNPRGNVLEFGWDEPLQVDGAEVPIADYPRLENRFCRSEHMSGIYHFTFDGADKVIDFTA